MDTDNKNRILPLSITWDDLENAYVCEQGYCYKTLVDIPKELLPLVEEGTELYCLLEHNKKRIAEDREHSTS